MKRAARLPLTFVLGLAPRLSDGDSRNMAAQIDSEESAGETTLYRSSGGARRWMTDAPEAETHLLQGIKRRTVGGWLLSDEEATRLREHLDRGGFLIVHDWRGIHDEDGRLTVAIHFRSAIHDLLCSMSH